MPPKNEPAPHHPAVMVQVGSPEFHAAVTVAVAAALAGNGAASEIPGLVQRTSLDMTKPGLDDLTVRFNRFCTFQGCGYQRGQEAGFPRAAAESLVAARSAVIVHDPRR